MINQESKRHISNFKPQFKVLFWLFITALLIFLAFNRHSKTDIYYYRSQIYGDKAGYYVYLPATFIYHFDAQSFPAEMDQKTGNGFTIDLDANKVRTKYFYGVSLMQSPFFLTAHVLAEPLGFETNGFSLIYHWAVDLAAIFYLLLAFQLLYKILKRRFSGRTSFLTIFFLFTGTNLFYYSIQETGMSHVYSFFLFAVWIYLLTFWKKLSKRPILYGILSGVVLSLIIFTRPLNLLFVVLTLFYNKDYRDRLRAQMSWRFLLTFSFFALLIAIPQFIYWNYLSGSFITYSYAGESFSNWMNPKIIEFLISPNNGALIYNPILLLMLFGVFLMIRNKIENAWFILVLSVVVIYTSAAWWIWSFGCGYAARNLVEYSVLLSFPLAFIIQKSKSKTCKTLLLILLLLFASYNIKMIYSYGGCWFGDGNWDWSQYVHWILKWPA